MTSSFLPLPSPRLLNLYNTRKRFNFPSATENLPPIPRTPPTRPIQSQLRPRSGRTLPPPPRFSPRPPPQTNVPRSGRTLPPQPGSLSLKLQTLPGQVQLMILSSLINTFLKFMKLNQNVASIYRVPLTQEDIQHLSEAQTNEDKFQIYTQYTRSRNLQSADPYQIYQFPSKDYFSTRWNSQNSQTVLSKLIDAVRKNLTSQIQGNLYQDQIDAIDLSLIKLENPDEFYKFLNSPIPQFSYLTIVNTVGSNGQFWNLVKPMKPVPGFRNVVERLSDGSFNWQPFLVSQGLARDKFAQPSLNILETGEVFRFTINKPTITLHDILIGIMSVKFLKEDFSRELLTGFVYDPVKNELALMMN